MLSNGVRKQTQKERSAVDGAALCCACPRLCNRPRPQDLLTHTTKLEHTPSFGHTECTHSITLLISRSAQSVYPLVVLSRLCLKTHQQSDRQRAALPRHLGKVSQHTNTHVCTKSWAPNVHPFLWLSLWMGKFPQLLIKRQYVEQKFFLSDALTHRGHSNVKPNIRSHAKRISCVVFFL